MCCPASVTEGRTRYTEVTVVGERFMATRVTRPQRSGTPEEGGSRLPSTTLPFRASSDYHRRRGSCSQIRLRKASQWLYRRNLYDSLAITVEVAEHHQRGACGGLLTRW